MVNDGKVRHKHKVTSPEDIVDQKLQFHDFVETFTDVKGSVANGWILPNVGRSNGSVCYQQGYPAYLRKVLLCLFANICGVKQNPASPW